MGGMGWLPPHCGVATRSSYRRGRSPVGGENSCGGSRSRCGGYNWVFSRPPVSLCLRRIFRSMFHPYQLLGPTRALRVLIFTSIYPNDLQKMNEALARIDGIIKSKLLKSIDRFHGAVQAFEKDVPESGYALLLTDLHNSFDEIFAEERAIESVFDDQDYSYLSDGLRRIVPASKFGDRNKLALQVKMRYFVHAAEVVASKFPTPDGKITSILSNQAQVLRRIYGITPTGQNPPVKLLKQNSKN